MPDQLILLFILDLYAGKPADVLHIFPGDHFVLAFDICNAQGSSYLI